MNLNNEPIIQDELIQAINIAKVIVISGPPGAGKTTLSALIHKMHPESLVIHSDDYIEQFGYKEALYAMMEDIKLKLTWNFSKVIIEGIQTARLLRKGLELGTFSPDLVIKFNLTLEELKHRYAQRDPRPYPEPTAKANQTVFIEYLEMLKTSDITKEKLKLIEIIE